MGAWPAYHRMKGNTAFFAYAPRQMQSYLRRCRNIFRTFSFANVAGYSRLLEIDPVNGNVRHLGELGTSGGGEAYDEEIYASSCCFEHEGRGW